jgi:hypothetical protein
VPFDDESAPVEAGRWLQVVKRRRAGRSRSVFRTHRPWRRRIAILAYVTAFAAAGTALVATASDIADEPPSPGHDDPVAPRTDQPLQDPHKQLDSH